MYRYFFRFVVTTLTILIANLLTTAIGDYMISYKNHMRPVVFTLIAMGIIVIIFYPLFTKMEEWVKTLSVRMIRSGKSLAGKYMGLTLIFVAGLLVLLYFYAKMWYHIDLAKALFNGTIGGYL
ncbi:MAG TPA: hypothetical protein DDY34_11115 [Bacteroidales bacterium]|nr:hypothetical protein [Bacteroidales bacterium]